MLRKVLMVIMLAGIAASAAKAAHWTDPFNVIWTTPSKDSAGSMPLGNGIVGMNLWVEENGDLRFYVCRNDSYSEVSRLLKVGSVRISLTPNPFKTGALFRQELVLKDGACVITAGEGRSKVTIKVFADSDSPVIYCTGKSDSKISVKACIESWRAEPHVIEKGGEQHSAYTLREAPFELRESADIFPKVDGAVAWYHRNEESPAFESTIKVQSLESIADKVKDPLIHRTFGGWISGAGFNPIDNRTLATTSSVKSFSLTVSVPCLQADTAQVWLDEAKKLSASADLQQAEQRTSAWWNKFWDRSWVVINGDDVFGIPDGGHPLRVGFDSNNENKFQGEIGHVSVQGKALTTKEIASLNTSRPVKGPAMLGVTIPKISLKKGLTIEAWIKPTASVPGRIVDSLTAGNIDGFLLDTYPGDTLRLIIGGLTITAPSNALKIGEWQHVAATAGPAAGEMKIYLNGKVVAQHYAQAPGVSPVSTGYNLQRYVQACGGRGPFPIKFNGTMFTVDPAPAGMPYNADYRTWGDCHWWQNIRFPYNAMIASGDFEMMDPLFGLYERVRPLCEARAKLYHNCEGSYFPETMTVWGTYSNGDYGWNRKGHQPNEVLCPWWQYAWNQGPELVQIMLERWDYTQDDAFLKQQALPMAVSVLKYFDTRFKKDSNGKIVLDPTQAVETLWHGVINDMPSTACLVAITRKLCALPEKFTTQDQREFFAKMKSACPDIPVEDAQIGDKIVSRLAVAQKYNPDRSNCENPELYGIWPSKLFGVGKPGIELAKAAYETRANHLDCGWGYDGICAAMLGMADEAARIVKIKAANSAPAYRWPATWGPNFDWLPDQDHGSNLLLTTQLMLLQCDGDVIRLLPAWPKEWDVSFKLHAPKNTTVECIFKGGKIESLKVTPESRLKDVVMPTFGN